MEKTDTYLINNVKRADRDTKDLKSQKVITDAYSQQQLFVKREEARLFRDAKKLVWDGDSRANAAQIDKELGMEELIEEYETSDDDQPPKKVKPSEA